jgi:hypothetical protein
LFTLLLSSYSASALSPVTTRNVINGHAPYLTFDGGRTRAANVDDLLTITLPGFGRISPASHPSSLANPIELQYDNVHFSDIGMFVPPGSDSVSLSSLISSGYWKDDDGDGNATATGQLTLTIVDKNGNSVARDEKLTVCNDRWPYKLTLSTTGGTLSTSYGTPNSSTFTSGNATYYLKPKVVPTICFAKPGDMTNGLTSPSNIWNPTRGFLVQSTDRNHYDKNFPTTGANKLYFDLDIVGVTGPLTWTSDTHSGVTASVTRYGSMERVTLKGPGTRSSQRFTRSKFELIARDSRGAEVFRYGFVLRKWFTYQRYAFYPDQVRECSDRGARLSSIQDLTNSVYQLIFSGRIVSSASPSSGGKYFMRHIGAGFFAEWGNVNRYSSTEFSPATYRTSTRNPDLSNVTFDVNVVGKGCIDCYDSITDMSSQSHAICVSP